MQRQLIRDVAHNQPIPALAHLPSQANRPNQGGGGWICAVIGTMAARPCFLPPAAGGILRMEKPQVLWKMRASIVGQWIQEWAFLAYSRIPWR